jgi:hypothetical protein
MLYYLNEMANYNNNNNNNNDNNAGDVTSVDRQVRGFRVLYILHGKLNSTVLR